MAYYVHTYVRTIGIKSNRIYYIVRFSATDIFVVDVSFRSIQPYFQPFRIVIFFLLFFFLLLFFRSCSCRGFFPITVFTVCCCCRHLSLFLSLSRSYLSLYLQHPLALIHLFVCPVVPSVIPV